jgi:TPR repeat protein
MLMSQTIMLMLAGFVATLTLMAADVTGKWTFQEVEGWTIFGKTEANAPIATVTLELKAEGPALTAVIHSHTTSTLPNGKRTQSAETGVKIINGKIDGDNLSFDLVSVNAKFGVKFTTHYTGSLDNDTIHFTRSRIEGDFSYTDGGTGPQPRQHKGGREIKSTVVARRVALTVYSDGRGVPQSDADAATRFRKAAEAGDPDGMIKLGYMYATGRGVPQSDADAFGWYRKAADAGNPDGMYGVGAMYADGRGVPQSDAEAAAWFRRAADAGSPEGMNKLGVMYAKGRVVPRNDADAAVWYRKAADGGSSDGMNNLGYMYAKGLGVRRDDAEAVAWFRKAADAGSSAGMDDLGYMYANGRGVPASDSDAAAWYRKAADAGSVLGMYDLGVMYQNGRGLPQDYREAAARYRSASERNYDAAKINLGILYQMGWGVVRSPDIAKGLYAQAAKSNDPEVAALAIKLADRLRESAQRATVSNSTYGYGNAALIGLGLALLGTANQSNTSYSYQNNSHNSACLAAAIGNWDAMKRVAGCPF